MANQMDIEFEIFLQQFDNKKARVATVCNEFITHLPDVYRHREVCKMFDIPYQTLITYLHYVRSANSNPYLRIAC